ncbi:MAG: hypothetical protein NVSMB29_00620 [Candidatus Dormibacteria bacterium]
MKDAEAAVDKPTQAAVPSDSEWRSRPVLSALLRAAIIGLPMVASLAASTLLTRLLPFPTQRLHLVVWFVGITLIASAVFFVFQRLLRRLLPLAALLNLTMIFPDRAPARFAIARRAGRVRDLEAAVARGQRLGDSPGDAAATVLAFVTALTSHDRGTRGHSERTRVFTDMLAAELGLSRQEQGKLRWSALLHDIGKLHVPAALLNKPGKPDRDEWEVIKAHPEHGARMIAPLVAWLGPWAKAVDHHHEKYNGTGYPRGLVGKQISLAGRIVAVADAYETMTAPRPYKKAMSVSAARQELVRSSGSHFDPVVVRAFLNISVGRLRRAVGLAAWVGQIPAGLRILEGTARLGGTAGQVATAAAATAGLVTGVVAGPHLHTVEASAAAPSVRSAPLAPSLSAKSPAPARVSPTPSAGQPSATADRPRTAPERPGASPAPITFTTLPTAAPPAAPPAAAPTSSGAAVDLAPVVSISQPAITTQDGTAMGPVPGSFTDPDSSSWSATVDYGDNSGLQPLTLSGMTFVLQHTYSAQEGTSQLITVRVRDNQGAVGVATVTNSIVDASPIVLLADATLTPNVYAATGSFQDPGWDATDTYSASVDYGDGSPVQTLVLLGKTFSLLHTYPLGKPRTYQVRVTVNDSGGARGVGKANVRAL